MRCTYILEESRMGKKLVGDDWVKWMTKIKGDRHKNICVDQFMRIICLRKI